MTFLTKSVFVFNLHLKTLYCVHTFLHICCRLVAVTIELAALSSMYLAHSHRALPYSLELGHSLVVCNEASFNGALDMECFLAAITFTPESTTCGQLYVCAKFTG